MRHSLLIAVLVAAALTMARAEPKLEGSPAELAAYLNDLPRTVTLTGESEIKAPADRAVLQLKVTTDSRSLQEALASNAAIQLQIEEQLRKAGIPDDNIQSAKLSSTPQTGWFTDKAKNYKIEHAIRVRVDNEQQMRDVSGLLDKFSQLSFEGMDFEQSRKKELERQAVVEACADVARRKQAYEESIGVVLRPVNFSTSEIAPLPRFTPPAAALPQSAGGYARSAFASGAVAMPEQSTAAGFDQMVFTSRVTVEYEVTPK